MKRTQSLNTQSGYLDSGCGADNYRWPRVRKEQTLLRTHHLGGKERNSSYGFFFCLVGRFQQRCLPTWTTHRVNRAARSSQLEKRGPDPVLSRKLLGIGFLDRCQGNTQGWSRLREAFPKAPAVGGVVTWGTQKGRGRVGWVWLPRKRIMRRGLRKQGLWRPLGSGLMSLCVKLPKENCRSFQNSEVPKKRSGTPGGIEGGCPKVWGCPTVTFSFRLLKN